MVLHQENNQKIGVLFGGNPKFELEKKHSIDYGRTVLSILSKAGYNVIGIECTQEFNIAELKAQNIDIVFNALIGRFGEDGSLPAILEFYNMPYTGSGPLPSLISMNKSYLKWIINSLNINTPRFQLINCKKWNANNRPKNGNSKLENNDFFIKDDICPQIPLPIIVKANSGAFGIGSKVVEEPADLEAAIDRAGQIDNEIILEKYISGADAFVSVLNGTALATIEKEIIGKNTINRISPYEIVVRNRRYIIPGRFSPGIQEKLFRWASLAYKIIGCRGLCRADFRINADGDIYFLELNTQHSIRDNSMAVMAAAASNLTPLELTEEILKSAWTGSL